MQAFSLAWDVPGKRWFFLYPGKKIPPSDWLTGRQRPELERHVRRLPLTIS